MRTTSATSQMSSKTTDRCARQPSEWIESDMVTRGQQAIVSDGMKGSYKLCLIDVVPRAGESASARGGCMEKYGMERGGGRRCGASGGQGGSMLEYAGAGMLSLSPGAGMLWLHALSVCCHVVILAAGEMPPSHMPCHQ